MNDLDGKANKAFFGYTVRKDLVKKVKGNAAVPSYVLEYLLGQNCATDDEVAIKDGIESVKGILAQHYVQRAEAGLVRSRIKEHGYLRVIDTVSVALNEKRDAYEAEFSNLGIKKVLVDSDTVKKNQRLLVSGVWCIADVSYLATEAKDDSPWVLESLKPVQLARFDFDEFVKARREFSVDEWIDLIIQTIGFEPSLLGRRNKLFQVTRLIPYCERNYNLIELGPKGTGKSHVYSEFSPHGILISGGDVTPAKLFVNNSTGKIGLVGYWDLVAFDEFAGKQKKVGKDIVDIMKNYMANKSFSRGIESLQAEASMVFIGNTSHGVAYMIKNADLFDDLPAQYHDSAFIDRIHNFIPGWEIEIIRGEMFTDGYGFIVDYFAEVLKALRKFDYSNCYDEYFELSNTLSARDKDGINKTFSGLMKIIYPHKEATKEEVRDLLEFAIEGRKRVKDQLYRIDATFERVAFEYTDKATGEIHSIKTLEEVEYPFHYSARDLVKTIEEAPAQTGTSAVTAAGFSRPMQATSAATGVSSSVDAHIAAADELPTGRCTYRENQKGVSFDALFGPYLVGATKIAITDPYIRVFHQVRNLMEFMETVMRNKSMVDEVEVTLVTCSDTFEDSRQTEYLNQVKAVCEPQGIVFNWKIDADDTIHARHIVTDTGWTILLDRGLDIFQRYEMNDAFSFENRIQDMRRVKAFEVTYLRE